MIQPKIISGITRYYYVGKHIGIYCSLTKTPPDISGRVVYLGYSNDVHIPTRLNTGRVLHLSRKKRIKSRVVPKN